MPKTILVIEDNEANMRLFCDLLEAQGLRAVRAEYGMKGLRLARECQPKLIIMDVQLPDVSGIEVTQWIRSDKLLRHIPVIAVTAFAVKDQIADILASGCDAYIAKPIAAAEFLEIVERLLGEKRAPTKPSSPP